MAFQCTLRFSLHVSLFLLRKKIKMISHKIFEFQYLEMRFGPIIRNIMTIIFILTCIFFMPVIMFIPSLSFVAGKRITMNDKNSSSNVYVECFLYFFFSISVTKLNIHVVNTVMCYICVIYTMLGGIQAVVWTDVILLF